MGKFTKILTFYPSALVTYGPTSEEKIPNGIVPQIGVIADEYKGRFDKLDLSLDYGNDRGVITISSDESAIVEKIKADVLGFAKQQDITIEEQIARNI